MVDAVLALGHENQPEEQLDVVTVGGSDGVMGRCVLKTVGETRGNQLAEVEVDLRT